MVRYNSYKMRDGDPSVFGDFNCRIFGEAIVVTIDRAEDGDSRCLDILGVPMRRGDAAQHISGKNEYGEAVAGGFVRELGWKSERRKDGQPSRDLTQPHAVALVMGLHDPRDGAPHFAQFSNAAYFLTLRGIHSVFAGRTFSPRDVAEHLDVIEEARTGRPVTDLFSNKAPQHVGAIRRFLESHVGVDAVRFGLDRVKRWTYCFKQPAAVAVTVTRPHDAGKEADRGE